jgi:hypothetical protein
LGLPAAEVHLDVMLGRAIGDERPDGFGDGALHGGVDRKVVEVAGHLFLEAPKNRKNSKTIYPIQRARPPLPQPHRRSEPPPAGDPQPRAKFLPQREHGPARDSFA